MAITGIGLASFIPYVIRVLQDITKVGSQPCWGREQDEAAGVKSTPASVSSRCRRVKLDEIAWGDRSPTVDPREFRFRREFPATILTQWN